MFNSARQEGSTAASVVAFWGFGITIMFLCWEFLENVNFPFNKDNTCQPTNSFWSATTGTCAAWPAPATAAGAGTGSNGLPITRPTDPTAATDPTTNPLPGFSDYPGASFFAIGVVVTVGAIVQCVYGLAGFLVGPYAALAPIE